MERVLLVGTGGFGRCWWPALTQDGQRLEVVGVVEPDDAEREDAAAFFGVAAGRRLRPDLGDWSALGATVVIDSSPPWHHRENATRAYDAGLDLIVAKPLAPTLADAEAIMAAARHRRRSVAVAQQMRYFPCFLALRDALRASILGAPLAVRVRMSLDGRGWVPGMEWRLRMPHPLLLEAGIHHFDLLRWCLDTEIAEVAAVSWNPMWSPFHGDATVSAVLWTTGGVAIAYDATFAPGDAPAVRFDSGWEVICERGVLTVSDGGLFVDGRPTEVQPTAEPVPLEALNATLLEVWLAARRAGTDAPFNGEDNLRSMAVVERAVASVERRRAAAQRQQPVTVGDSA
jgi:predicted dehydrogenase